MGAVPALDGPFEIAGLKLSPDNTRLVFTEGNPPDVWVYDVVRGLKSRLTTDPVIDHNPILLTARPKLLDNPPEIFAVDELRSLLEAAATSQPDVLPMLAIGAFAGLREAEIQRLDWSEVDLARGHVEVKAAKAKSARRRIVPIQPNLAGWLRPYREMKGALVPAGARRKLALVREAAKFACWPQNGLRHSFASYRLAAIHDVPRVASELGHASPQMLYSTYREIVLPEEAERYWKIEPAAESANVVTLAAAS